MSKRLNMGKVLPEAYQAMDVLDNLIANAGIKQWYKEMIRIRASYINGCAYCVDSHTQDALKLGINPRKIALVAVWQEAAGIFDDAEQTILLLTEEMSLIHQKGISNEVYDKCIQLFGEKQTAELIITIITINAWNRIGVGLKLKIAY
jgi:AhpD family alkylhydroperoxidase